MNDKSIIQGQMGYKGDLPSFGPNILELVEPFVSWKRGSTPDKAMGRGHCLLPSDPKVIFLWLPMRLLVLFLLKIRWVVDFLPRLNVLFLQIYFQYELKSVKWIPRGVSYLRTLNCQSTLA